MVQEYTFTALWRIIIHLLMETPRENLSQILHHVNGAYTTYYNVKRRRSGHLFQGRYRALLVEKESYCQELSRYIHLNPVRAALVKEPEDYVWSSYSAYIGLERKSSWLETSLILSYFSLECTSGPEKISRICGGGREGSYAESIG